MNALRLTLLAAAACLLLAGCRVSSNKHANGDNVQVSTPFGSVHVKTDKDANVAGIGLATYPGAVPVKDDQRQGQRCRRHQPQLRRLPSRRKGRLIPDLRLSGQGGGLLPQGHGPLRRRTQVQGRRSGRPAHAHRAGLTCSDNHDNHDVHIMRRRQRDHPISAPAHPSISTSSVSGLETAARKSVLSRSTFPATTINPTANRSPRVAARAYLA